jgi:hypothetical protein
MTTSVLFVLSNSVARDYYGTFHAFLRGKQTDGTAGDIGTRLSVRTGSGGITYYTETKYFTTTNDWQVIDLGRVTLPASSLIKTSELADTTTVAIQVSAANATPDMYIYDLILIPTDEWVGEFIDTANSADSTVEQSKMLEIDSLTNPKQTITAKVKSADANEFVSSLWQVNSNGPAMLQSKANQRLWFFACRTASAGSTEWVSYPSTLHAVKIYKNEQYLGMRGSN